MNVCKTCGLKSSEWFKYCPRCGVEGTFEPIGATTLESLEKENEQLQALNSEYIGLLTEVTRLNAECCNWIYNPDLSDRIDKALEKAGKVIE